MSKEIVLIDGNDAYTTTLIIAEGCMVEHASTMRLLKTHQKTETLSRFEIRKVSRGGRPVEFAKLNELQTTFLAGCKERWEKDLLSKDRHDKKICRICDETR